MNDPKQTPPSADTLDSSPLLRLPTRDAAGHKGTFGTVVIIGGSIGATEPAAHPTMLGAPTLAGRAALRSGVGLCKLVVPQGLVQAALSLLPSATALGFPTHPDGSIIPHAAASVVDAALLQASAVVLGPGLGRASGVESLVLRVLQQDEIPVVVDADALNAMSAIPDLFRDFRAPAVLTPHPGEFARLAAALRITLDPVSKATRPDAAVALAQRLGCVVVLKGEGTIVSNGVRTWRCARGHPCLATAGTGDVLAGILGGLIAQLDHPARRRALSGTLSPHASARPADVAPTFDLFELARIAVDIHARAGERWAKAHGPAGLLAHELADLIPQELA